MRSDQKQKLQGIVAAMALIGVPFLLNACSGNPLNGEKLRLWKNTDDSAPGAAAPKPTNAPGKISGAPAPKPGATLTPCKPGVPNISGGLEPNDSDLLAFNREVSAIENPTTGAQPSRDDLRILIKNYVGDPTLQLGLTLQETKDLIAQILTRSPLQPPTQTGNQPTTKRAGKPLPQPVSAAPLTAPAVPAVSSQANSQATSETGNVSKHGLPDAQPIAASARADAMPEPSSPATPAPTTYFLHQSIVSFVAYKHAISLALNHDELALKMTDAVKFADAILNFQAPSDGVILAYSKAFDLAISEKGLDYKPADAQAWVTDLVGKPDGVPMALAWVSSYNTNMKVYGAGWDEAIKNANAELGYTEDKDHPLAGYCGKAPAAPAQTQPKSAPAPSKPAGH